MTSRDVFVVGVRIVGLLQLAKALDYLLQAFDMSTGLFKAYSTSLGACYSHILVYLGIGLYLLGGAPHLVRKIYGEATRKQTQDSEAATDGHGKI
jgi:hypothetical protein